MPHSPSFQRFLQLLQKARGKILQQQGRKPAISRSQAQLNRRRFLQTSVGLGLGGIVGSLVPGSLVRASQDKRGAAQGSRIAIIGAGLSGLIAAYYLKKAGYDATVFEARERVGGRVFSQSGIVGDDLVVELGGEFINSDHDDMLNLVNEFNLELFDRRADAANVNVAGSAYYFDGRAWSEAELLPLVEALVMQISADAELLDQDWDTYAPIFDQLSVTDYLDQHATLIPQPFIRTLFENSIRTEYGVEAAQSSALQLLFLLPTIDGESVELLGYSDEIYTVKGGNGQLANALADALPGQIQLGMTLQEIEQESPHQFELHFKNGYEYIADYVIFALPFSVLRQVKLHVAMPKTLRQFIHQVDLGHNEKVLAGYRERAWRSELGFSLEAWTDLGFSEVWDGSQRQPINNGSLTYFLGGDEVHPLIRHNPVEAAEIGMQFSSRLSAYVPDLESLATAYRQTGWTRSRYTRGAYVNYAPGQLTQFADYFWVESDLADEQQSVAVGNLIFAGEQLSDAYYGFMNGAAQTGRLAAQYLIARLPI